MLSPLILDKLNDVESTKMLANITSGRKHSEKINFLQTSRHFTNSKRDLSKDSAHQESTILNAYQKGSL